MVPLFYGSSPSFFLTFLFDRVTPRPCSLTTLGTVISSLVKGDAVCPFDPLFLFRYCSHVVDPPLCMYPLT